MKGALVYVACLALSLAVQIARATSNEPHKKSTLRHMAEEKRDYPIPTQTKCGAQEAIHMPEWVDKALDTFSGVKGSLYKDVTADNSPVLAQIFEDVVSKLVENSMQREKRECIYTVWSLSELIFELKTLMYEVQAILTGYTIHATSHLSEPGECLKTLIEGNVVDRMFTEIYTPVTDLLHSIDTIVVNLGFTDGLSTPFHQMIGPVMMLVQQSDPNHLTIDAVVQTFARGVCWSLDQSDLYQFEEPTCVSLTTELLSEFSVQLEALTNRLSRDKMEMVAKTELPPVCHNMIPIFLEEISVDTGMIRTPEVILREVVQYLHMLHMDESSRMEILKEFMTFVKLAFLTDLGPEAMMAHILLSHVTAASPLPLDTPVKDITYDKLEMICLDLFAQTPLIYTDSCMDYKQVAPLVGIIELKQQDLIMSNIHITSITEHLWRIVKEAQPGLPIAVRGNIATKFYTFVSQRITDMLKMITQEMTEKYGTITAFTKAKSIVLDVMVLMNEKMALSGTLSDLLEKLVHEISHSFQADFHSTCTETQDIYGVIGLSIEILVRELEHISPKYISAFTTELKSIVPTLSTYTEDLLRNATMEGALSLVNYVLDDLHLLVATFQKDSTQTRMTVNRFIGSHLASSLYKVIRFFITGKMHVTPTLPGDNNHGLEEIFRLQQETINTFIIDYINTLQHTVTNLAMTTEQDFCDVTPQMCSYKHHTEDGLMVEPEPHDHDHHDHHEHMGSYYRHHPSSSESEEREAEIQEDEGSGEE